MFIQLSFCGLYKSDGESIQFYLKLRIRLNLKGVEKRSINVIK